MSGETSHTIAVLGIWHLGEVYSACLAELGHRVVGISEDAEVILNLQKNIPPLAEPGLEELLERNQKAKRLSYSSRYDAIQEVDVVWFAFDTPVSDEDEADTVPIINALRKALSYFQPGVTIAVSSQLPAGTSTKMRDILRDSRPDLAFNFFYSPENLRLGEAVLCFMEPGRIVVGADTPQALAIATDIFTPLRTEIIAMSVASAEMTKHAINAWLATSISFTNDLSDICESAGADVEEVIRALKSDARIGPKAYLFAGLGFSGGTLGRDLKALLALAREKQVLLPVIEAVYEKNRARNAMVVKRLEDEWGSLNGKVIALFGIVYKSGTSTLRRSQPLEVEAALRDKGAIIRIYDPLAIPKEVATCTPSFFTHYPLEAAEGADAVLIMTPARNYQTLDFSALRLKMRTPFIFDTCNILAPIEKKIAAQGIHYLRIGV